MVIPVVSTEGPLDFARGRLRPERRDLLSAISCLSWREGLSAPRFALRSRRRMLPVARDRVNAIGAVDSPMVRDPLAIRIARLQTWLAYLPIGGAMAVIHAGMPKRSGIFQVTATLGALGVVYGDIGTSPLYALREAAKAASHGGTAAR